MRRIISSFKKSEFSRNFLILSSGTALSEIIPVLASPILTRLYTPEEFGVFMFYFTVAGVLSSISMGRYEAAIVLPKSNKDARILVGITLFLSILSSLILGLLFLIFHHEIIELFNLSEVKTKPSLGLIIFLMLSYNIYIIFDNWLNRIEDFSLMAKGRVLQKSITIIISLTLSSFGHFALSFGRILGQGFTAFVFWVKAFGVRGEKTSFITAKNNFIKIAAEYDNFPRYLLPSSLANRLSNNLPSLMLGKLFSFDVTGFYSWSFRIIGSPMNIITSSISKILYSKSAELNNSGKSIFPLVKSTYIKLALFGIIPFTILGVFAPEIFGFIFGEEWVVAGEYTQILIPWLFLVFLNNPVSLIFLVLEKQKELFRYEFVLLIARFIVFLVGGIYFKSPTITIKLYSLVGVVFSLYLVYYTLKIARN